MEIQYSIIIPTFNEEKNIRATLEAIAGYFERVTQTYEIIVSDDGSTDSTVKIVEERVTDNPNIILLKNQHQGKAVVVGTGAKISRGEYVLMMDADSATAITELNKLSEGLRESRADIAIGSREGNKAQRVAEPFRRHFMGRVFNFLIRIVTGLKFNDTQCGFKLFRGQVLKILSSKSQIMNQKIIGLKHPMVTAFDVELLVLARLLNYKVVEVPINWVYVETGNVDPLRDSFKMISEVLRVRRNLRQKLYERD